jgi:hypothetical protein
MTAILAYAAIGILVILVVALLLRAARAEERAGPSVGQGRLQGLPEQRFLNLSERIFDPADYLWLKHDLGQPQHARALVRARQRLAVQWLRILKASIDELVRAPEPALAGRSSTSGPANGQLLWLILRFHFLLAYALVVIRLFGPYHRLVPAFNWRRFIPESSSRESPLNPANFSH